MLTMELNKGTSFRDTDRLRQILLKNVCVFYFVNKHVMTEFQEVRVISKSYLIFFPNICGIW